MSRDQTLGYASAPGPVCSDDWWLEQSLRELESEAANFGARFVNDAGMRQRYMRQVREMSEELLAQVRSGGLEARVAAERAQGLRNSIMDATRLRLSDLGLARSQAIKSTGRVLDDLVEQYSRQLYRRAFSALTEAEKNAVYAEIVAAAGRSRPSVSRSAARLGRVGRGLLVLTIALAVYNIATAEDPVEATGREAAGISGGLLGGMAGGAVAGLACGPGAPVCVAVGVFVGGALGAFGADWTFSQWTGH